MGKTAAIIGAGIGGLAAALRLRTKGYQVEVYEQAAGPGGKIKEIRMNGFRFDTGPSLFTFPALVDELFSLFGENPGRFFRHQQLDSSCKYFWDDGTTINAWQNPTLFSQEIEQATGAKGDCVLTYLRESKELYDIAGDTFIFHSLHNPSNYFTPSFLKTLLNIWKLDPLRTLHDRNRACLKNPKLVQIFDRYATYNGSSPYKTPSTLRMIAHLEHNTGAHFPRKGMFDIVASLERLAVAKGVKFHYNARVETILTKNSQVQGVRVNGLDYPFNLVLSDVDVVNLYNNLLSGVPLPENQIKQQRSSSAVIFYWGINKAFPNMQLHNILFSNNYRAEFDHLFETRTMSSDPTVYVFISSKIIPEDAPEGMENWYVMVNAPEDTGLNRKILINETRSKILEKIRHTLRIDLTDHIVAEAVADPQSIESETGSYKGSLYGLSSNNIWAAFNRHPNFSSKIKGLYFVGGSVHPGGGIPLCMASAKIIDKEIPSVK